MGSWPWLRDKLPGTYRSEAFVEVKYTPPRYILISEDLTPTTTPNMAPLPLDIYLLLK